MVSERTFLMKLFLAKNLEEMREMCVKRSEDLDDNMSYVPTRPASTPQIAQSQESHGIIASQSPSMQRLMQQNPDLIPKPPVPVTPAAAQALQQRQNLINGAINGEKDEKRRSPRKF